jgi:hypothetical protein
MKERLYTVRVHTHPEMWGNKSFLANSIPASKLLIDATPVSDPVHPKAGRALRAGLEECARSIPRTSTVSRHSEYLFSSDVIQRVICESISWFASQRSSSEIV